MANTLKFGNGNWATKEDSVLAYNDENNNFKPLPFDFTRASTATYVDSDGLIKTSKQGEARIDYTDSSNGTLLLEPSRTNLITQSNQFDTTWISFGVALDSNQIGVGGSANAWKLTSLSGDDYLRFNASGWSGENTYSIYAKSGTLNSILMTGFGNTFFNLETGVVGTSAASNASIEFMGNGWYRCSVTGATNPSQVRIYPSDLENTNTNGSIYIQYAQLELGSYATSYIPTNGSSVTRIAETCNNSGNSEVFNDSEGVLFANLNYKNIQSQWSGLGLTDGNDPANRIVLYTVINTKVLRVYLQSGGTVRWTPSFVLNEINQYQKVAIKYKANDNALWLNGFEVALDNTVSIMPTGLDRLGFFSSSNLEPTYASTKELGYYDTALTDLELETLTSYTSWVSMVNALNLNIIYNG